MHLGDARAPQLAHSPEQELRLDAIYFLAFFCLAQLAHSPEQELRHERRGSQSTSLVSPAGSFTRTGIETEPEQPVSQRVKIPAGSFTRTGIETASPCVRRQCRDGAQLAHSPEQELRPVNRQCSVPLNPDPSWLIHQNRN